MTRARGARSTLAALAACWALGLIAPRAAWADENLYETQRMERALRARSFALEPQPEGKRIAFIAVAQEDVFVEDEVWPVWPNLFHWLTDEDVIRRELLFAVGDRYDPELVEETMRNLRQLGIFALVRIVPVRAPEPGQVGLLVYTRDLWSLRLETIFSGTGQAFQLTTQLVERNFLGRNKVLAARFHIDPKRFSVGQSYGAPRLAGGELAFSELADVFFNRESGEIEGSQAKLTLSSPYRRLSQRWGFSASASYADYVERELVGTEIASYTPEGDLCTEPDPDCLRSVWDDESYAASLTGSYRRGEAYKQTFSLGVAVSDRKVAANRETGLAPGQETQFAALLLPRARRQVYPFASYSLWLPDYVVFENLSTFGKSENVRVGPELAASVSFPLEAFGSSTDSVKFSGGAGYVLAGGDALSELSLAADARLEEGRVVDQHASAVLRGATPQWVLGRLVLYAGWEGRRRDTARVQAKLGGDSGLRGYEAGEFRVLGGNRLLTNFEWRTLPVVFESVHLGGVVFYDAGSVYTKLSAARLHHSVGAGLRLLFPQFNQSPFRLDFGVPLDREGFAVLLSYGSDQAVPLTAADDAASAGEL